ncbi:hypothetical protein JOF53_007486 [Crossiella equi]|uniref:PET hydrolase/cutinase-like domain-containing protein n=1 Tax=Crossiella equi TaxID=130796 RepID=A0ABS5AQW8_9PSEU|nr:acetylxylan esterase [Crossiella equi]MBP2478614.1 hypothetical protein [Crossiella equi]
MTRFPRRWASTAAATLLLALLPATATAQPSGCPSVGRDWAAPGPFAVTESPSGAGHTVFRPAELGSRGCAKHPVLLWGNGSYATPADYAKLLRHLASHGFLVAAADTTQSGSGKEMLAGLDHLTAENTRAGSPYEGRVDLANVGAAGHSQGGGGAILAGADPRVRTTVPIQPGPQGSTDALSGPVFYLGGQLDVIVAPLLLILPRFRQTRHIPAVYGELAFAGHSAPSGDGGGYRGPITAWLRYHLLGDPLARAEFYGPGCHNCAARVWSDFRRNDRAAG